MLSCQRRLALRLCTPIFTGVPTDNILGWLVSIVAFNGIFEVITGAILVTIIGKILVPLAEKSGIKG